MWTQFDQLSDVSCRMSGNSPSKEVLSEPESYTKTEVVSPAIIDVEELIVELPGQTDGVASLGEDLFGEKVLGTGFE